MADSVPTLTLRERSLVTLAGVVPDIDGLGAILDLITRNSAHPTDLFARYHHQLHNLGFALVVAGIAFAIARHRWLTGSLALLTFHLHLFEDLIGARGPDRYQWPIPYLSPFSHAAQLTWSGQWALNAWPNFVITVALLLTTFYLAWSTGHSPLEMVSKRADDAFVATLRRRFPRQA